MAAAIYRGMDRTALDAAYNNSEAVADSPQWLARWRERSALVRARPAAKLDIAYGPRPRERLDYFSCGKTGAPLFVFIHGGYWQRNDKDMFAFLADGPLAHDIDVAMVGYTLAPDLGLSGDRRRDRPGPEPSVHTRRPLPFRSRPAVCRRLVGGRPSDGDGDVASGGSRRIADLRHLRSRTDRAQLSQREAPAHGG